jgi:hypothetical protein
MSMTVLEAVQRLRASKSKHLEVASEMMKSGSNFFTLDFLAIATLNRSLCLVAGFCTLIESKNIVAAAPLLRMQLDNCLRFSAAWIVDKPHEFASQVLGGVPIRKLKDRAGRPMTDRYLLERLAVQYPWLTSVYEHSSGYVHLSEKHIFNTLRIKSDSERIVEMKISERDEVVPERFYFEVIEAFSEATKLVLAMVFAWATTKDSQQAEAQTNEPGELIIKKSSE